MKHFGPFALVFLAFSCAHAPATPESPYTGLAHAMTRAMRETGTPGAVMAIVSGGTMVYLQPFGVSSSETETPMRDDAVFRIASLTKSFTGLTAAVLADRSSVELDVPIGTYAPDLPPVLSTLTLSQLLSHSAGLRDEAARHGPRDPAALAAAARHLTDDDLFTLPGDIYSYSNLGYTLAGFVLESATKTPFARIVETEVLHPARMQSSTFDSAVAMTYPLAIGHSGPSSPGGAPVVLRPFWDNGEALSRGGLFSSAPDLARFAIAIMNAGRVDGAQAIPSRAVERATTAKVAIPGASISASYGFGFRIDSFSGTRQIGHFGGGMGYGAILRMLPEHNAAVVILTNRTSALLDDVADLALRIAAGLTTSPATTVALERATALPAAEARARAGKYRNGSEVIDLVEKDGALFLEDDESMLPIQRAGEDELVVRGEGGAPVLRLIVVDGPHDAYVVLFGRAFRRAPGS